jgi:hypothetical protein
MKELCPNPKCQSDNTSQYNSGIYCNDCHKRFEYILEDGVFVLREVDNSSYTDEELRSAIWE